MQEGAASETFCAQSGQETRDMIAELLLSWRCDALAPNQQREPGVLTSSAVVAYPGREVANCLWCLEKGRRHPAPVSGAVASVGGQQRKRQAVGMKELGRFRHPVARLQHGQELGLE